MNNPTYEHAKRYARAAGLSYLILAITGIFGGFIAISSQVVPGDPVATANNILNAGPLYRFGVLAWVITLIFDVIVAWALFAVLRPVNAHLSLLAALFRVVYIAIHGAGVVWLANAQKLADPAAYGVSIEQSAIWVTQALITHKTIFEVALIFFGLHLILLAWMMFKSGYMPKLIGLLLIVSGTAYIIDGTAYLIMDNYDAHAMLFVAIVSIPAIIAELALTFWLLIKGVGRSYPDRAT